MSRSLSKLRWSQGWRRAALASTALSLVTLAAPAALAAPPAAGSLPGNFTPNGAATATYALGTGSTTQANIAITSTGTNGTVLQFGVSNPSVPLTTSAGSTTLPSGVTQNGGFSLGNGASVAISGTGSLPVLITDGSGAASQIYGSVTESGAPLYVANPNGVIVGGTGSITAPGVGLLGYAQSASNFDATALINVDGTTKGTGEVTVMSGATIAGGGANLLVAGNGSINVGANPSGGGATDIVAGYGMNAGVIGAPGVTTPLANSTAAVTLSGGTSAAPMSIASLSAAGGVTNTGSTTFAVTPTVLGTFTNSGVAQVPGLTAGAINNSGKLIETTGALDAVGAPGATSGADVTNTGVIDETNLAATTYSTSPSLPGAQHPAPGLATGSTTLTVTAGKVGVSGNFSNTGVIDFSAGAGGLAVNASNIQLAGTIQQLQGATADAVLGAKNVLTGLDLTAKYTPKTGPDVYGVVDTAGSFYAANPVVTGQAIRVQSGNLTDPTPGSNVDPTSANPGFQGVILNVGTGTATDPFASNAKLNYNLSVYPKASVQGDEVYVNGSGATATDPGTNINLPGTLSTQITNGGENYVYVNANSINANLGGGFAVNDQHPSSAATPPLGEINLNFSGNVNDPIGATSANASAFQYNNVPVTVGPAADGGAGTALISLQGPTDTSGTAQNVNILVNGNVTVESDVPPPGTLPTSTTPISPAASSTNNHLVVQSTGNVELAPDPNAGATFVRPTFYWPGLTYLSTVSSASNPTSLSSSGSITLGHAQATGTVPAFAVDLNNILPSFISGGGGVFVETNSLNLNGGIVSTSNNSWVNFATPQLATAYATTSGTSFFGAYKDDVTSTLTQLGLQQLPADYFVGRLPQ